MVSNGVLERRKQAVVGIEAKDVPRIDNRSAVNASLEQRNRFGHFFNGRLQVSFPQRKINRTQQAIDLADDSHRRHRNVVQLLGRGFGITHASVDGRQPTIDQLVGAAVG